jgi:hypothetical protein
VARSGTPSGFGQVVVVPQRVLFELRRHVAVEQPPAAQEGGAKTGADLLIARFKLRASSSLPSTCAK